MTNLETLDVLGVKVSVTNPKLATDAIEQWIHEKYKTYVCVAPVSTVMDCQSNEQYRDIVNHAGMTTPDGMPLVWIGKMRGLPIERTYGPDLMLSMCDLGQEKGYRHYFYGGTEETNNHLVKRLQERFPQINIAGCYAPPNQEVNTLENQEVLNQINEKNPDIVWVGLGSPKQDVWMSNHREKLQAPVIIGVGAAFDFIAGTKAQAPIWMRKSGLEWLFRLCSEPKRLWRRYLVGNSQFLYLTFQDWYQQKFQKK